MASVKVAVRVRPFNQREVDLCSHCIVEVEDKKTKLINNKSSCGDGAEARERVKEFTFDYSYWSHKETDHHFAPQVKIYDDLGTDVVSNALQGYNACVFAYGQTGSGKTFTMMGSQNNPGLIPRICEALFSSMAEGREAGTTYKVEVSYLEIYNERVKDLLRPGAQNSTHSLRVREHPKLGPYVQDLSVHLVQQYPDIEELMRKGNSHRTTASTHMNDTSSRSHAIFTVTFIQAKLMSDTPLETRSKIHLVDLAGSERADATGATGQRLKEGAHINKSLVTLGSVISALAEQAAKSTSGKNVFIPYRDSVLTWLLKDSLGGNSKTIMIATISPADVNYGETLSTLRYANRAKNIINKPTINEDPNVKLIRELREEILLLKMKLQETTVGLEANSEKGSIMETLSQKQAKEKELTDQWTERWSETHTILQEQKTLGLRKAGQGVVLDSERPHLVLIDDNLLTTGVTLYHLNDGLTTIGSLASQDIRLEGGEVLEEHCTIELHDGIATLESKPDAQCWVNSQLVDKQSRLTQGCVVVLGGSHMFRYNDPQEAARLRKEGNKTHLNLSRLSFLSRSATDLIRSCDNISGMDSDLEKTNLDSSNFSRIVKMSKVSETTDLCEISTQTSLHTHSQPTSPIGSHIEDYSINPALRKSSLTLPLGGNKEDVGVETHSINSTPASDTFYTATSVLSPDPHDLTSPLSPLPLDVPRSGNVKNTENSNTGACGALVDKQSEMVAEVPIEDVKKVKLPCSKNDSNITSSQHALPAKDDSSFAHKAVRINDIDTSYSAGNDSLVASRASQVGQQASFGALLSPIRLLEDSIHSQDFHGMQGKAASTPLREEISSESKNKDSQSVKSRLNGKSKNIISRSCSLQAGLSEPSSEVPKTSSYSDADKLRTYTCSIDNENSESFNNNIFSGNGNPECSHDISHIGKESQYVLEDNITQNDDLPDSSDWYPGLSIREKSELISQEIEVGKAAEVLMRLRERSNESDISIGEQIRELEELKQHYGNLEDQLIQKQLTEKGNLGDSEYGGREGYKAQSVERPSDLPLDSSLLQEDRLALLIEREVQRRVLEEVVARENEVLNSKSPNRRTYRSMSASMDHWSSGVRVLTPSEVRPYTSMSAGYEMEGEIGNHLYQSATSADDLLLTPGPLQSPLTDYDMSCGICVCIPGYEMRGAGSAAHWEYEVKIAAGNESWTVFRRYRRFRELHMYMCHKYGQLVEELYFPPRRLFGNFSERVVAERRGQLEVYLQQLIVLCSDLEGSPLCGVTPSRAALASFSPFFQRGVFELSRHSTS